MAALVQTIPQQTGTVPVLQTRPTSSSSAFTTTATASPASPSPSHPASQHHTARNSTMSWNPYNNSTGSSGSNRSGHQVVTRTPTSQNTTTTITANNNNNHQSWAPQLRPEQHRTSSAPSADPQPTAPVNPPAAGPVSPSVSAMHMSKDDSALPSPQPRHVADPPPLRPLSTINIPSASLMNNSSPTVAKSSPDRYRRGNRRAEGIASPTVNSPYGSTAPTTTGPTPKMTASVDDSHLTGIPGQRTYGHARVSSADDVGRTDRPQTELAKRYRRRSWGNMDNAGLINLQLHLPSASPTPYTSGSDYFDQTPQKQDGPGSIHSQSSASSGRDSDSPAAAKGPSSKPEDMKRVNKPSPLSQPLTVDPSTPNPPTLQAGPKETPASPSVPPSPATQRLTEMSAADARRPGKSRLRRAFSFGSASELIKASNGAQKKEALAADKTRRELLSEELGPEQAAIAEQQEASGLGESIYSHYQGHLFNRSTDNLSVSSTASSASVMLRKMGKGMKRSTRSLVGLFRPKSLVDASITENGAVDGSAPQVSMVNVEADRSSVIANPDPQDLPRGGTMFPKVEPPEVTAQERNLSDKQSRKSIIGGERERAEVLAAVKKGILKKTQSGSAPSTPTKSGERSQALNGSESPHSSTPSTPEDPTRSGKGVKIAGEDYFGSEVKGAPSLPMAPRNLVFSPRIQLHDTWTSGEYDRRGEIATCNRLTPLLAQQIKEELNNFKMEMEVHETSKVYTHFL